MVDPNDQHEVLTRYTADELLRQSRSLMDHFGIEEGQHLARKALTWLAKIALNGSPLVLPTVASIPALERKAVAHGAIRVAMTMKAGGKALTQGRSDPLVLAHPARRH